MVGGNSVYGTPTFHKVDINLHHLFHLDQLTSHSQVLEPATNDENHHGLPTIQEGDSNLSTTQEAIRSNVSQGNDVASDSNDQRRKILNTLKQSLREGNPLNVSSDNNDLPDSITERREILSTLKQSLKMDTMLALDSVLAEISEVKESSDDAPVLAEGEWLLGMPVPGRFGPVGKFRNFLGVVVNSGPVSKFLAFLIVFNAVILGVLTFNLEAFPRDVLNVLDLVLLCVFTTEFSCQILYLGPSIFQNGWLVWDGTMVALSWAFVNSSMRSLRAFRVFRVYAIMSRWPALRNLVRAIGSTLPKMATIWVALFIFFYTFCVLYTGLYSNLWDEGYLDYNYFGRLDHTFLTLFQFMTLDSWTQVVRQVLAARPWAWIGFVAWVIMTSFFILNLIIAVITESLIELRHLESKNQAKVLIEHNQNLMAVQSEELLLETRQVAKLQQEMLRNQIEIQNSLKEVLEALNEMEDLSPLVQNHTFAMRFPAPRVGKVRGPGPEHS